MNTSKIRFYADQPAPNGVSGLLICDTDDQVIGYVPDALFGYMRSGEDRLGNQTVCLYGESIGMIGYDDDILEAIQAGEFSDLAPVAEITRDEILEHLAVSPVQSSVAVLRAIVSAVRG